MKPIGVLLNLFYHFYRGTQCDKTFVHDEVLEVQHEMLILGLEFKKHTKSITSVKFPSNFLVCLQSCVFDDSVNSNKIISLKMIIYRVF